jgi:uncharacterized protein involved in exopolysaccharide biosynthesis
MQQEAIHSQDASFGDLVAELWRSKILLLSVTVVFAVLAAVLAFISPPKYRAQITVSPVEHESGGGALGSLAAQYGGLAAMAGITLGGGNGKSETVAVLQSDLLTASYIKTQNLLPILYADKWDAEKKTWKVTDPKKIPTIWKACQDFKKKIRKVNEDRKSGLVVMDIVWKDPQLAAKWANDLVKVTNDYLRDKATREATRNITYLNEQARNSNIVEARKAIFSLMEDELNKEMLARGREEYAMKVIDPAVPPEKPASLSPIVMIILGAMLGGIAGALIVVGRRIITG